MTIADTEVASLYRAQRLPGPAYRRLKELVVEQIASGRWTEGQLMRNALSAAVACSADTPSSLNSGPAITPLSAAVVAPAGTGGAASGGLGVAGIGRAATVPVSDGRG